jgi:hypothetical protein
MDKPKEPIVQPAWKKVPAVEPKKEEIKQKKTVIVDVVKQ